MSSLWTECNQAYSDLLFWRTLPGDFVADCAGASAMKWFINNLATQSRDENGTECKRNRNVSCEDCESIKADDSEHYQVEKEEGNGLQIQPLRRCETSKTRSDGVCVAKSGEKESSPRCSSAQLHAEESQSLNCRLAADWECNESIGARDISSKSTVQVEVGNLNSNNNNGSCGDELDNGKSHVCVVTSGRIKPFAITLEGTDLFSNIVAREENPRFGVMGNSGSQLQPRKSSKKDRGFKLQSRKGSCFQQRETTTLSSGIKARKRSQSQVEDESEPEMCPNLKCVPSVAKEETLGAVERGGICSEDQEEGEEKIKDADASTPLTLRSVCCAISSPRERMVSESKDTIVETSDRLHPGQTSLVSSPQTCMSSSQTRRTSAAERSIPCPVQLHSSADTTSNIPNSTVNEDACGKKTDAASALHGVFSSIDGFSGALFCSWLLGSCHDSESKKFVQRFGDSLLRARILVLKSSERVEKSEKDTMADSEGTTLFKRLKFVPSQIYTWGPFSRMASSSSSRKTSSYKDYAVRQVEIRPTVASETPKQSSENELDRKQQSENQNGGKEVHSGAGSHPTTPIKSTPCGPSLPGHRGSQNSSITASSVSSAPGKASAEKKQMMSPDRSQITSPGCTNSSKKLTSAWPPPRPEDEDDAHRLKYTEAEHQHEMMVMKRNHTDELYKITKDYETNIYEMNDEHTEDIEDMQQEANLMRQEIAYLKAKLNADKHDAATQTQNVAQLRMTKGVQVNLTGESLPPPPQISLPTAADEGDAPAPPAPPPPPPPAPAIAPPPPPPPAALMGGPPPPPPPGLPMSKKDSPRRAPVEPKRPMKPLYWKRIQISKKELSTNRSVWAGIEDLPINVEEMEQTFGKTTTTKKSKALSETIIDKKKVAPAKIFDAKRSQAVGIFLSSLHVEMADLQEAIINLDTSIVDEENMKSIYDLRASSQEIQMIHAHVSSQKKRKEEERQPLDKPEKFLYELSEIENFEDRLFCITFRSAFNDDVNGIKKELAHINDALQELQDKNTVLRLLGLVLNVGNYLNGGNRSRGQADGFQLDILSKLKDVKGQKDNASFTLLNYIAWVYMRTYDQDVKYEARPCPVPSFQSIILASQVNFSDVSKELKRARKELKECEKRVSDVVKKAKRRAQPFKSTMEKFVENAHTSIEQTDNELKLTQQRFKEGLEFFCVKPKSGSSKTIEPKDFFVLWQTFCMDFHAVWKIELKRLIKEEQQKAKKMVEEYRERQTATTVVANVRRRPNSLKTRLMQTRRRRGGGDAAAT